MELRGELRVDPPTLDAGTGGENLEIVVPYTEWSVTESVLKKAVVLLAGLNARVRIIAIHTVPYPSDFECQAAVHTHLVEQLIAVSARCGIQAELQVVLARSREEGFRHALTAHSTVLLGSRKHWWRTTEESLAHKLARDGHRVALLHIS